MPVTPGSRPRRPALRAFHRPRVWLAVWAFGWVLCVVLSLVSPVAIDAPSGSDKFGHLLAYFVLAAWAVQLFATWRAQALAAAALVALGIALELAQAGFTTDRLAEPADALADTLGVLLGLATAATPLATALQRLDRKICSEQIK